MGRFDADRSADIVVSRNEGCEDPRLQEVMRTVIRHLHAAVKEIRPTPDEWMRAIQFLTETGQISDEARKEFILLSDTLGVTMLVDALNHERPSGATENTVLGPFHVEGAERLPMGAFLARDRTKANLLVEGRVLDSEGEAVEGAELDVWKADDDGTYDVQRPAEGGLTS